MKLFNYIFYVVLFLGFFLPTNTTFYIPIGGALVPAVELAFILLPIINAFCISKNQLRFRDKKLKKKVYLFLGIIFFTEIIIKRFAFGQGLGDAFSTIRIGIPLFSTLIILVQGVRADVRVVWKVLLWAISCSIILSLVSLIVPLPIYYDLKQGANLLATSGGRIGNANASFGIIGLYLLFEEKDKWFNQGKLVKWTAILSVIALVLTFNRTYLALLALEGFLLAFKNFKVKKIINAFFLAFAFLGVVFYAYHSFDIIQRQIDKRILSIVFGENTVMASTIEGNRDVIYEGIAKRLNEGYFVIGLPNDIPIFTYPARNGNETRSLSTTDTSFINVLLRYGIIPFILWIMILRHVFWKIPFRFVKFIFLIFALASLNTDALMRQNSIFFLIIILFISFSYYEKKHSLPH